MPNLIEILKNTAPFNTLPDSVLTGIAESLVQTSYSRDTLVYRQEVTEVKGVDFIVKGEYATFFFDSSQNKRSVERHHPPYCFGGISILLNRTKALKSAMAKKGTVVYQLPRQEFLKLCHAYDDIFQFY